MGSFFSQPGLSAAAHSETWASIREFLGSNTNFLPNTPLAQVRFAAPPAASDSDFGKDVHAPDLGRHPKF